MQDEAVDEGVGGSISILADRRRNKVKRPKEQWATNSKNQNEQLGAHNSLEIMNLTGLCRPLSGARQGATSAPLASMQDMQSF